MILSITAEYSENINILLANSFPYISNLFHFLHYAKSQTEGFVSLIIS